MNNDLHLAPPRKPDILDDLEVAMGHGFLDTDDYYPLLDRAFVEIERLRGLVKGTKPEPYHDTDSCWEK